MHALLKTSVEERRLKLWLWTMYHVLFQGKEKYQLELELRPLFPSSLQVWCFCNATEAVVGIKRWGLFLLPGGISWITHSIFYVPQSVHYQHKRGGGRRWCRLRSMSTDVELPAVGHLWPHLLLGRTRHPCGITRVWRLQWEEFLVSLCPVDNSISSFIHSSVMFVCSFIFIFFFQGQTIASG